MSKFEVTQSSLDAIYDQLSDTVDILCKAQRRGNSYMARCAQDAIDSLHAAADEMEAVLADRRFAA